MMRQRPPARRGFAMAFVLLLTLVVSLMIGASLSRQDAQSRTVSRLVKDYQTHHDMLGVRAIIEQWMSRKTPAQLVELAESEDDVHHRIEIEGVLEIVVRIEDGQGLPVGAVEYVPEGVRDLYEDVLERLPEDRRGLLRPRGAHQISIATAPRPVLAALLEDHGEDFADEIIDLRERDGLDQETFAEAVRSYPGGDAAIARLAQIITFEPAVWRLRMTMTDEQGSERLFGMLAEVIQGGLSVHEWMTEADLNILDRLADGPADDEERPNRRGDSRNERTSRR